MRTSILVALSLVAAIPAFAQAPRKKSKTAGASAAHKSGPDLPSRVPAGTALGTVNGEPIPLSLYIDRLSLRYAPDLREALIEETLIRQEAKKRKITATPAEVNEMADKVFHDNVQQYGDEKRLGAELQKTRGWSLADFKEVIRMQTEIPVLRKKIADSLVKAAEIKDADIEKQYSDHQEAFRQPDTVRISHILIRRPATGEGDVDKAAKAEAEELLKKATAPGADFAALAKANSQDKATSIHGGTLPVDLARGAHPFGAAFDAVVFNSPTGVINQVIPSPVGYHVIRVDSKKQGRLLPLAEVKDQVRTALLTERRERAMEELFVQIRTRAKIQTGKF